MAYEALPSKGTTDTLDLTTYNKVKGNFEACACDAMAALGDLFAGTGSNAGARLAVGTNDAIIVAASGEATGLAWQNMPTCRLRRSADYDPTPGSWQTPAFDVEDFDLNGMHAAGGTNIVIPSGGGGVYDIGVQATFGLSGYSTGSSVIGVQIILTATATVIAQWLGKAVHASINFAIETGTIYSLAAADSIAMQVYTEYNVNMLNLGNYSPVFWATWQRRQ